MIFCCSFLPSSLPLSFTIPLEELLIQTLGLSTLTAEALVKVIQIPFS